jgi:hypothetical protein
MPWEFGPLRFGPQRMGGRYRCGYWEEEYTVLAIGVTEIVYAWASGRVTRHMTPWDSDRDRVIA